MVSTASPGSSLVNLERLGDLPDPGAGAGGVDRARQAPQDSTPSSGAVFPHSLHGGPGRAGGGEELGCLRGLAPYLQRIALQGHRALVDPIAGA